MAIIGQSKNKSLYEKVTEEGSKYRDLKYADLGYSDLWNGQPVLHGYIPGNPDQMLGTDAVSLMRTEGIPPVSQNKTDVNLKSEVLVPVTARINDVERITRLLTKVPGIKWEAHNAELEAIQSSLEQKRGKIVQEAGGNLWTELLRLGKSLIGGLVGALDITTTTLAQVAVAGTGAHLSSWLQAKHAYLGKDAASDALHSGKVTFNLKEVDGSTEPDVSYRQLPLSDKGPVEEARKPKGISGGPVEFEQHSPDGKRTWFTENVYGQPPEGITYEDITKVNTELAWFGTGEGYSILSGSSKELESAKTSEAIRDNNAKPGAFTNASRYGLADQEQAALKTGNLSKLLIGTASLKPYAPMGVSSSLKPRLLETGSLFKEGPVSTTEEGMATGPEHENAPAVSWRLDNEYTEGSGSYIGNQGTYVSRVVRNEEFNASHSLSNTNPVNWSGPWRHDGALSLVAGTAGSKKETYQHDGGQTRLYTSQTNMPTGDDVHTRVDNGRIDMIPFWIRAISADGTVTDNAYLFFEANLDSYSDTYDASWESTQYIGRADKFWTYSGFDRQINFSFKMVAHTKSHLKPVYNRLNGLLSMTTPTYSSGRMFMQGVLAEVTIGDLLDKQLGFIKNVSLKWETDYMWETDNRTIMVPHVLNVSVGFTPIHQFAPQLRRRYFELAGEGYTQEMFQEGNPFGIFTANGKSSKGYKLYTKQ